MYSQEEALSTLMFVLEKFSQEMRSRVFFPPEDMKLCPAQLAIAEQISLHECAFKWQAVQHPGPLMHAHMHALHVCKNSLHALNCSNTEYSPQAKYCGSQHDHPAGIKLKDRAECIAHRAAAHPQVKVWHFCSLHRP